MGESFQDYSWIQDFEADFPNSLSDSFSVYLQTIDPLNLKLLIFCRYIASFEILFS